jgi:hypothetical protein
MPVVQIVHPSVACAPGRCRSPYNRKLCTDLHKVHNPAQPSKRNPPGRNQPGAHAHPTGNCAHLNTVHNPPKTKPPGQQPAWGAASRPSNRLLTCTKVHNPPNPPKRTHPRRNTPPRPQPACGGHTPVQPEIVHRPAQSAQPRPTVKTKPTRPQPAWGSRPSKRKLRTPAQSAQNETTRAATSVGGRPHAHPTDY